MNARRLYLDRFKSDLRGPRQAPLLRLMAWKAVL
jgi:hypothetical protein